MSEPARPDPTALSMLTPDERIDLAVASMTSRRAVKMFLHNRRLDDSAASVDAALLHLQGRADWPAVRAAAERLHARRGEGKGSFDPRAELVRQLDQCGRNTASGRADLAAVSGVSAGVLEAMLDGADVPLSVASKVLNAAGAVKIEFGSFERSRTAGPTQTRTTP